jgi:uncharacterized protein YeaO (DUF488 family)
VATVRTKRWNDAPERDDGVRLLVCRYRPRAALAARVGGGERLTLLCSSACIDPERCHRTLLKGLIEKAIPE